MLTLPTPRIRVHAGPPGLEPWTITLGDRVAELEPDLADRSAWPSVALRWRLGEAEGVCYSREHALRLLWCRVAREFELLAADPGDAWGLAYRAELGATDEAAAILGELLRARTGRTWSCLLGKGRRRAEVTITAKPRRRVGGVLSAHDGAVLAALLRLDYVGPAGVVVGARIGERARAVLAVAGVELVDWRTLRAAVERRSTPAGAVVH